MNWELTKSRAAVICRNTGSVIRTVLLSTTTKSAAFYAFGGIGFSGANLLLAKFLPISEYATIALAVAILSLTRELAPLGAQGVILRHKLQPHLRMLSRVSVLSALIGATVAVGAAYLYELDASLAFLIFVGTSAGGLTAVAASFFQSRQRFKPAMLLTQSSNLFFLIAGIVAVSLRVHDAWFTLGIIVLGYCGTSAWAWQQLLGQGPVQSAEEADYAWREALSYMFVSGAVPLLLQLERLLIPQMLSLENLATFGVLAAIVMAPYRMLQEAANFTVLPRLRAADTVSARRRLPAKEGLMLTGLIVAGSALLMWLTPLLVEVIYRGKFDIGRDLILAGIAVGCLKAYGGLAMAAALALCPTRQLGLLGPLVWLAVVVAVIGASVGAAWGLTGLVIGIGAGWLLQLVMYASLAGANLKS